MPQTTSKPKIPGIIDLDSTGVVVSTPSVPDTDIVVAGDSLSFILNLSITGNPLIVPMYANEPVEITHHVEEIETGNRFNLGPFARTTPASLAAPFSFTTGAFTSSLNGGGGQFQTAAGDDDGVYRVVTELHFNTPAVPGTKANSVFDDRIMAITAP